MPAKITKKYYDQCSLMKFACYLFHNPTGGFCVLVKRLSWRGYMWPASELQNLGPVPQKMVKFNPGLSQNLSKVF